MKILISRNDKLGDFILSIPAFQAVKRAYPESTICALVSPLGRELAEHVDEIDEVIIDEGESSWDLSKKIRAFKPDTAITIFSTTRLGWALFLAGVKRRIAPATKIAQIFYNKTRKQKRSSVKMREFEYNLDLLKAFDENIDLSVKKPILKFDTERIYQEKIIGFHIGFGGSSIGNISEDDYIDLGRIVAKKDGMKPLFTFGPNEYDLMEKIEKKVDYEAIFYKSEKGIVDFAKLISTFECFVATSTGTLQLAGALNIPTFGFFGDTLIASPKRWGTLNDEEKQHNYTIYEDENRQKEQMDKITNDFKNFLEEI
ncbi:MAG: glycosyltransferase family 9 protein [Campylobacterales bacterium]|nr:glycosyltransferase family 9 protein [Campylobacterales bacterium]